MPAPPKNCPPSIRSTWTRNTPPRSCRKASWSVKPAPVARDRLQKPPKPPSPLNPPPKPPRHKTERIVADITAALVKQLRERTGAAMMDCKNALVEAKGDLAE